MIFLAIGAVIFLAPIPLAYGFCSALYHSGTINLMFLCGHGIILSYLLFFFIFTFFTIAFFLFRNGS